jgi:hypothetical protein
MHFTGQISDHIAKGLPSIIYAKNLVPVWKSPFAIPQHLQPECRSQQIMNHEYTLFNISSLPHQVKLPALPSFEIVLFPVAESWPHG